MLSVNKHNYILSQVYKLFKPINSKLDQQKKLLTKHPLNKKHENLKKKEKIGK